MTDKKITKDEEVKEATEEKKPVKKVVKKKKTVKKESSATQVENKITGDKEDPKKTIKKIAKKEEGTLLETSKKDEKEVEEKVKKPGFMQAIGRRKKSVARVKLYKNGSGKAVVNEKGIKEAPFPKTV